MLVGAFWYPDQCLSSAVLWLENAVDIININTIIVYVI